MIARCCRQSLIWSCFRLWDIHTPNIGLELPRANNDTERPNGNITPYFITWIVYQIYEYHLRKINHETKTNYIDSDLTWSVTMTRTQEERYVPRYCKVQDAVSMTFEDTLTVPCSTVPCSHFSIQAPSEHELWRRRPQKLYHPILNSERLLLVRTTFNTSKETSIMSSSCRLRYDSTRHVLSSNPRPIQYPAPSSLCTASTATCKICLLRQPTSTHFLSCFVQSSKQIYTPHAHKSIEIEVFASPKL